MSFSFTLIFIFSYDGAILWTHLLPHLWGPIFVCQAIQFSFKLVYFFLNWMVLFSKQLHTTVLHPYRVKVKLGHNAYSILAVQMFL